VVITQVADSIGDCMIIVCTVREQVHWAKKAGSIWLEFLAKVWEEMHRHLDSEDMMAVVSPVTSTVTFI